MIDVRFKEMVGNLFGDGGALQGAWAVAAQPLFCAWFRAFGLFPDASIRSFTVG